jgi:hypothetical protein
MAGANGLVLNTHVQSLVALHACGVDIAAGTAALDWALRLRPPRGWGLPVAAATAAVDVLRAAAPPPLRARVDRWTHAVAARSARLRSRHHHLRLPGGWLARDVRDYPGPAHYVTVNLNDLAGLARNGSTPTVTRAVTSGVRLARGTGFFRAQRRAGDPLTTLVPVLLNNAGHPAAAARAAVAARRAGWPATIGWPGYQDRLWRRLEAGTP